MGLINTFASVRLFFTLSALMLAAFILGGVIPQGESPQAYQEMFGRLGGAWVMNLRFNNVFSSFWFLALMAGGALNILACTVKQWKVLKLRPGVFLSHLDGPGGGTDTWRRVLLCLGHFAAYAGPAVQLAVYTCQHNYGRLRRAAAFFPRGRGFFLHPTTWTGG
ncbi:MAG: cytochrome c biogenesis protein ResB [Elusimicrobia bacterium]|nr:cytochrome c biogenesis protein ResB [Elusimicrobiota bacterium]